MLITVIVVTYNSSSFVLTTLESILKQTYKEIELIISDDCSKDNTLELCKQWLSVHKSRFQRVKAIHTPTNGGICKNYNFALSHAKGEWIKYIAGDDILEENCIERFVDNIRSDTFLYTCIAKHYHNESGETELFSTRIPNTTAWRQARFMLRYLYGINGPTIFIERKHLVDIGGFEEKYPMIEDWPIAIRFVTHGLRIGIIDEPLVHWRIYTDSISHSNHSFAVSLHNAFYDYTKKYCLKYLLPFHLYHHWLNHRITRNNKAFKLIGYFLRVFDLVNIKRKFFPIPKEPYKQI